MKKIVKNKTVKDYLKLFHEKATEFIINTEKENHNFEIAKLINEAEVFVNDYVKKNGTKSFISERLRNGFIGELIYCEDGTSYIQSIRGKPFGTIVAIPTNNNVVLGMSYLDSEDMEKAYPIIGLYIALKRALKRLEKNETGAEKRCIKSKAKKQIIHFEKRALAFFHPDIYSYSRGSNPVHYDNYDEIHQRRKFILGE